MLIHNLTSGWRNILKYKTQNIISVLCIAVGVLIFSITLYGFRMLYYNAIRPMWDDSRATLYLYSNANRNEISVDKVQTLKSVKEVMFFGNKNGIWDLVPVTYKYNGETYRTQIDLHYVNNAWLEENCFCSVTTGKALGHLKNGTVLITTYDRDRYFGKDYNPIGVRIKEQNHNLRINDVVYSSVAWEQSHGLMIVSDNGKDIYQYDYDVILNDGFTKEDLKAEAERTFHDYVVGVKADGQRFQVTVFMILLCFLGATVLIIGLSGYLKMQLQLFQLRRREIALRRCHGAHTGQLFRLLCSELAIIFCITAVTTVLLSVAIADYAMPILEKLQMTRWVYVDLSLIYTMEAWVVVLTFLFSVLMAWLSVRRILKDPLSQTVGKSFRQKSRWAGAVQVLQFFTATILFFIISLSAYLTTQMNDKYCLPESTSIGYYKNIGYMWELDDSRPGMLKEATKLKSVERVAMFSNKYWQLPDSLLESSGLTKVMSKEQLQYLTIYNKEDHSFGVQYTVVEPDIFPITKVTVHETDGAEEGLIGENLRKPIFAYKEEAAAMRKLFGLKAITPKEITFMDSLTYVRIGYAAPLPLHKKGFADNSFYILQSERQIQALKERGRKMHAYSYLLQPKDGDFKAMKKDVDALCHKLIPAMPANSSFSIPSAYDQWYSELQIMSLVRQATLLMSIVTLLCIILTVYSSVALETRSRQKEVAIRKVHGAKLRDIVMLFGRYYLVTLAIAFLLAVIAGVGFILIISEGGSNFNYDDVLISTGGGIASITIITLVTILTVWSKIHNVANVNATDYLRKE
ncbi:MAG: ABC transporter permease [Prevotella sp.]|nr:ABC transporter permease [Candidatus Prevotella equi]